MTKRHEVHLELLLGKHVRDKDGLKVGRIEEVRAHEQGEEWVVKEYLIGPVAILERLSALPLAGGILGLVTGKVPSGYKVPWDKLDLSDPEHPCLTCTRGQLEPLTRGKEAGKKKGKSNVKL